MAMSMSAKSNQYWNGSEGTIWVNDNEWDAVSGFEVNQVNEWEEVPVGLSKHRVQLGYEYTGSFTYRKTDNNYNKAINEIFTSYANGVVPDVYIIAKAENKATGKVQRIKISEITFDEITIQQWEERSLVEEELSFYAYDVEIIQ